MITSGSVGVAPLQPVKKVAVPPESGGASGIHEQGFYEALAGRLDSPSAREEKQHPAPNSANSDGSQPAASAGNATASCAGSASEAAGGSTVKRAFPAGLPATAAASPRTTPSKVVTRSQQRAASKPAAAPANAQKNTAQKKGSVQPAESTGTTLGVVAVAPVTNPAALPGKVLAACEAAELCARVEPAATAKAAPGALCHGGTQAAKLAVPADKVAALVTQGAASVPSSAGAEKHAEMSSAAAVAATPEHDPGAASMAQIGASVAGASLGHNSQIAGVPISSAAAGIKHPEIAMQSTSEPAQPLDARTLAATSNSLEVGVASGTHGWLRVRAELSQSGVVTAAVVASSASSAEALSRHLPEMSQYLTQESTQIGALVVHASAGSSAAARAGDGAQGAMQAGAGQGGASPQGGGDQSAAETRRSFVADSATDTPIGRRNGIEGMWSGLAASQSSAFGGSATHWVSVRV